MSALEGEELHEDTAAKRQTPSGTTRAGKLRLMSIDDLDGRTAAARRARELVDSIASDLGGDAHLTEGTRQLARRAAVLGALIEHSECTMLAGGEVELSDYLMAVNAQRRVLATIGLERRSRDVTPSLASYIEAKS